LKILCPYLEDIFFIQDSYETSVVVYDLICKNEAAFDPSPNIIFSKDIFMYQLPALKSDTVIFRSSKKDGQDQSWAVNHTNVIAKYIEDSRGKCIDTFINPGLLSALMTMTNVPSRGINSIFSISKAISLLQEAITNGIILNQHNYSLSCFFGNLNTGDYENLDYRFKAIDILFQHTMYVNTPNAKNNIIGIKNLYDPETVKALNNQYFKNNPLDLNRL